MKVLFVLNQIPERPDSDGLSRWFFNTLKSMRKLVSIIDVAGQATGMQNEYSKIQEYCNHLFFVSSIDHSKYRYKWFAGWDYSKIQSYNPFFIKLLQKICVENQYDLVILVGHGTHVNLPFVKARHIMVAPLDAPSGLIVSPENILDYFRKILNDMMVRQSERSYNSADSVLVVSERDGEILQAAGVTAKIIINPISVDTEEFFPRESQSQAPFVFFTGVLSFKPNYDAAMHLVNDIYLPGKFFSKGIMCRIAGHNSPKFIQDLQNRNGVEILEGVPDLRPLLRDALVYVAPMRIGLGMKTKILEAMAMGKPIVGYPLTFNGIKEPEQFALVCHSPFEIINAIDRLFMDIHLRTELGRKARIVAENIYSSEQITKGILEQTK